VKPEQEGWYTDPYGRHEARWLSAGVPTRLVRDGKLESYEDPPDSPPSQGWVAVDPPPGSVTSADTLRADAAEAETMPSLAELNKNLNSAALTAQAHPWFVARDWLPSSNAKPISTVRRATLIGGGVVTGLILLFTTFLWTGHAISLLTTSPPTWGGALLDFVFALVAPVGTYLIWRGDRRARVSVARRIQRAELGGGLLGLLTFLIFASAVLAG
jgi:hypothetical protein